MPRNSDISLPSLNRILGQLGSNLKLARLRRKLSTNQVAERAGINRMTLGKIESGNPSVSLGNYLKVMHVLGLHKDMELIAHDDELGRKLQDAALTLKKRAPKRPEMKHVKH